jgi:hypothetical protein
MGPTTFSTHQGLGATPRLDLELRPSPRSFGGRRPHARPRLNTARSGQGDVPPAVGEELLARLRAAEEEVRWQAALCEFVASLFFFLSTKNLYSSKHPSMSLLRTLQAQRLKKELAATKSSMAEVSGPADVVVRPPPAASRIDGGDLRRETLFSNGAWQLLLFFYAGRNNKGALQCSLSLSTPLTGVDFPRPSFRLTALLCPQNPSPVTGCPRRTSTFSLAAVAAPRPSGHHPHPHPPKTMPSSAADSPSAPPSPPPRLPLLWFPHSACVPRLRNLSSFIWCP